VFIKHQAWLAASAQLVLSGDRLEGDGPVAGQFRVAGQVLLDPGGFPGVQTQFQVDMHKLDQHTGAQRISNRQIVVDFGPACLTPRELETLDGVPQRQPIVGEWRRDGLGSGEHNRSPRSCGRGRLWGAANSLRPFGFN